MGIENGRDIKWHANELLLIRNDPDCIEMVATQESYLMILNSFIKITYDFPWNAEHPGEISLCDTIQLASEELGLGRLLF